MSLSKLKIAHKIPMAIAAAAVISVAAVGVTSYVLSARELTSAGESRLTGIMESRVAALRDYLETIRQDLRFQARNPYVQDALREFSTAWQQLGPDREDRLQRLYITNNPHPTGQKENLDFAPDGSDYSRIHGQYHPWFRTFLRERGYYDIFLFDTEGDLVYSVFKEADYATNLNSGQWKDTDLGNAFRAAAAKPQADFQAFFDFQPYAPSADAPAAFISTPVVGESGQLAGVLVFQMPIGNINAVMQNTAGMGESGEAYIVGPDFLMRSDSRFSEESTILKTSIRTKTVEGALEDRTGVEEIKDYRGVAVLSAYGPLEFLQTRWAIISEIESDEALAGVAHIRDIALLFGLGILIAVLVLGVWIARGISRPIAGMTDLMHKLAGGERDIDIPDLDRTDEIGLMGRALQIFKDNAIEADRLAALEAEERAKKETRAAAIEERSQEFDSHVTAVLEAVAAAATEMQHTAQSMTATAEATSSQANVVANASEMASSNVQTVAASAEELSSSISEISRQISHSTDVVKQAEREAGEATSTVDGLDEASKKIDAVVGLIQDIAEQTNLLALNATIEAARAGEAGKGFAVVASEVKSLANQTAKATEEISGQISSMQAATTKTVQSIASVRDIIGQVGESAVTIASAVEEQNAATQEISRSVQEASSSTQEVASNIGGVSQAATETGSSASEVLAASAELSQQAEVLSSQVKSFLEEIKAA